MSSLRDGAILITGAASGLGRQLALDLLAEGAAVAAIDCRAEPLQKLAAALPEKRLACAVADVTDRDALGRAVADLQEKLGPLEVAIACAGIGIETSAANFHAEDFERVVRINLIGVANTVAAVLPGMLARGRGQLVAISSLASFRGLPRMAAYCAAKSGVNALMDSFRVELQPRGIAVTTICPGWIRTPMTANLDVAMPDILEAETASRLILDAIHRRRPFYAFPKATARPLRLLRWLPARLSDWLIRRMAARMERNRPPR
jgi:NAD(P)-dependent dehydrogenase (short-subunit alcohol dehydrogenase family)